jgi:hypothetical protein
VRLSTTCRARRHYDGESTAKSLGKHIRLVTKASEVFPQNQAWVRSVESDVAEPMSGERGEHSQDGGAVARFRGGDN